MIHPQHDAFKGSAILPHRSENVRMKLPRHPEPKPNKLEDTSRGSKPILIARYIPSNVSSPRCRSLSMSGPEGRSSPLSILPGLFPRLKTQDNICGEVTKRNPIRIQVSGRRTAIRVAHFEPFKKTTWTFLQSFLSVVARVAHVGNLARKDMGNVTKDFGEITDGRVKFRVSDDEGTHSSPRCRGQQDRAYPPGGTKTQMEIFAGIFGLVR